MITELQKFYKEYKEKMFAYNFAFTGINFDQATIAPEDGNDFANRMSSVLQGEYFAHLTAPEHIEKLELLYDKTEDSELKKELALDLRNLHQISKLPKEVYVDFELATAQAKRVWEKARENNDYESFKPHLLSNIEKQKNKLTYYDHKGSDYDYLLDQFERGMTTQKYDVFFEDIKEKLVPLIHRIKESGKEIDKSALEKDYDIDGQKRFLEQIKEALKIDPKKCYISESAHPFCALFSLNDVRFTTRYIPNNLPSAILSTIHEYGHGLYDLQLNPEYEFSSFATELGFAMHESQSRLLENYIGRNKSFWQGRYPKLQEIFPEQLGEVTLEHFMEMINVSEPSLIRVEADELTYPLHVLIRYELEKAIFDGSVDLEALDTLWADKYEEYLGIRPETHKDGILQDIHWSGGMFGYFPSYALGSAFAAQFYNQMKEDLDVDDLLLNDNFQEIAKWLKENIHQYGASKTFSELLVDVTGEDFNPNYYTDYLVEKYTKLYF